jgi:hypothetical protein
MKIALLYFGQPRFIDNFNCYESQKQRIMSQGDCDVFAHLWEPNESGYNFSTWSGLRNVNSSNDDIEKFRLKWEPASLQTEKNREFGNEELYKKFRHILPGGETMFYNFNLCLSQLYSIEKVIDMYHDHVNKTGKVYDYVIFLRTDLCIWDFPNLKELEKGFFYFSSIFHFDHFADLCYITDPKYIDGLKAYSYITDERKDFSHLSMGNAEGIKKASFLDKFSISALRQVPIPVRVVRGNNCTGPKW